MHDEKNNTIYRLLSAQAEHAPEAIAIGAPGRSALTYRGLLNQVERVVKSLHTRGVRRNDRVAIVLPNGSDMAVTFLGVAASAICAPLNPAYSRSEFEFYLSDLNPKVLIVQSGINSAAIAVAELRRIPVVELFPIPEAAAGVFALNDNEQPLTANVDFPRADDIALILHTSGTTSRPKMVPLTQANLLASAGNIASTLRLSAADCCLNVMPLFHIHGLVGALLSSVTACSKVICTAGFDIEQFFPWLEAFRPTWYTAVPTIHHAVLTRTQADTTAIRNHSLRFIRSSSSALPARVLQGLEDLFEVPVIESYGMTEAAHQMASNPLPPGQRKVGSVGLAAGPEVSIMDQAGSLLPASDIGEIVIRGANVMHGYDNDSDANGDAFTRGWFRTGDQGYLDKNGYLFITGRLKEIINRGGEKISPREVDDVILQHPAVAEAFSFAVPHKTLGEDIAAAVVLRKQGAATELELQQFVASRLADFKVPRQIIIVEAIPKTATGKIQRIGLAEKLGLVDAQQEHNTRRAVAITPGTQTEKALTGIWSAVLGLDVGPDDNLFRLGGNSIHAAQIISRIRNSIGAELSFAAFFESPTVAAMAKAIENTSQKSCLVKTSPFPEDAIGSLSFTQEALWFLDQLDPGNTAYNRPVFASLQGSLNLSILEKCLSEILRRHSSLRTRFPAKNGEPLQHVYPVERFSVPLTDISSLSVPERESQLRLLAAEEARKPFDLAKGPTFRAKLVRVEERLHILLATAHHIVFDGWSAEIFLRELQTLYDEYSAGRATSLTELPIQYLTFARCQRDTANDELMKAHVDYWKRQLNPGIPPLDLTTDRPRPVIQTFNGAKRVFRLPIDLLDGLKAISHQEKATLFMTLLSAFKILLHHYSRHHDIIVGTPFAGRNQIETEEMIGNFTTTLPLYTNLSGNPSFRELLARVRKTVQEAHAHQIIPFETIAPQLRMKRDSSRPPVYQVLFQLRNYPQEFRQIGELRIEKYERESETSAFDLSVSISDDRIGLKYDIVYNTDLFEDSTIERMAAQFGNLIKNIVTDPEQTLSDFPWLTATKQGALELSKLIHAEARPFLAEGNNIMVATVADPFRQEISEVQLEKSSIDSNPRVAVNLHPALEAIGAKCFHPTGSFVAFQAEEVEQSIPCRFEKIVSQYPDRVAIKYKDRAVTYAELNTTANRIAHTILALRGEKEEPVVLLFDHGVDVVAAIIGVLKAGKFFVALDSQDPIARNLSALKESRAELMLTCSSSASLVKGFGELNIQILHSDFLPANVCSQNPELHIAPSALTYVGYTSGSTGVPKGVMQNHRNLLQQTMVYTNTLHISVEDRLTLLHSCTNGASTPHLFSALLNGATLFPFNPRTEETENLARWLIREGITIYHSVSALFRDFTDILTGSEDLSKVRIVHLSGDTVTKKDLRLYQKHFSPDCIFVNRLGSREANTVLLGLYDKSSAISESILPIGPAVEGKEILLLGDNNEPVGGQSVGEIVIRSRYLSPGYWRNSEQTNTVFECPGNGGDERLYRTGDLGRLLVNGCYQHLGRKDSRVKVRGFRIELAEIEIALLNLAMIKESAVLTWELPNGEIRLIAYVVSAHQPVPTSSELRRLLRETLPDYMIPASIMFLDRLPRNLFGKIDRRAIPAPTNARPVLDTPYSAPRTPTEEQLSRIWAEILCLDQVGTDDNFFDLGGHSLAATRVVSQVIKMFQLAVPLRSLFEAPTVAKMAAVITANQAQKDVVVPARTIIPRRQASQTTALSFAQQRLWFLSQLDPQSPAYNQPKAIRMKGTPDIEILKRSLETIIARHEVLRTTYSAIDGQPSIAASHDVSIEVPTIDLSGYSETDREAELQSRIAELTERPFDLSRDLTLRTTLLKLGPAEFVLLLVTHHIASDGWSNEVLRRELTMLYEAFVAGEPNPLPELPIQYADYAVWQREWVKGEILEKQLSFWKTQLLNIPVLELPTDRSRPAIQTSCGARQSMVLSRVLSDQLNDLSRNQEVTLFMTLLAAFQTLLCRYTGQDDIAVGSPIAGRTRFEFESLIGIFVNTLVLRTDLSGNPSFRELLARVRKVALEAYQHQDVPFEKVVEEVNPERNLSHTPLFKVNFAFQNLPRQSLELAGLTVSLTEIEREPAKFDLTLYAWEEDQGLKISVVYNTDVFDASTMTRMLVHFETLLKGIVSNADQRISDLPILTEKERHQLIVECNEPRRDYPKACILELFEKQVGRTPDAVAVIFDDQQLTYRDLNTRANQLAHCLRRRGVGPETLIAICAERSLEMVIGLVGILKSGAAYLPLDPNYPAERIAFMLADSVVPVLLTQKCISTGPLSFVINGSSTRETICLDSDWKIIAQESTENPSKNVTPENLAYVIYTSGSTGKPKGVMVTHANIARLFSVTNAWFTFNDRDVWTLFHSYAFDFSVWEMWGALLYGGRLVVVPHWVSRSPGAFWELVKKENVTVLNQTPSAFRPLMSFAIGNVGADPLSLRWIIFGGEALDLQSLRPWMDCYGDHHPQLVNMYGITETTVHVTYRPLTLADTRSGSGSLIGRPIPDLQLYILDRHRQLVPIGVPGEVYVAGAGVARGYLNRPELTDERFILCSFDGQQQAVRLYRSGDRARRLSNGDFEYLGRVDNQVKIRGFRIEIGEIEAVLNHHPAVREVAVVARENRAAENQLVAYVVLRQQETTTVGDLQSFMKAKLPDYMIPAAFVFLDILPLTPNGKVDRRALPEPDPGRPELEQAFVAPQNDLENNIATVWRDALHLEKVGIHDNFFDLGGHSLLLVQVHSRVQRLVSRDLSLIEMFEHPTVHSLANHLSQGTREFVKQSQDRSQNRIDNKIRITRQRLQRQRLSQGE